MALAGHATTLTPLLALLACTLALAQDVPFPEERPEPWTPRWELTARAERVAGVIGDDGQPMGDLLREGVQLRLRWGAEWSGLDWEAGLRSAVGSDGNRNNIARWDQQPSNGTQLDLARAELYRVSEQVFGRLRVGFQELGLLTTQAVWDDDLRFLGAAVAGGYRAGLVEEAGLRAARGRVRTVYPGNDVDLGALQAVLKLASGAHAWTFHVDRWNLAWDADEGRFQALQYGGSGRQRLVLDGVGGAWRWDGPVPLEARWSGYRERSTRETSEEFTFLAGSRVRLYRPQFAFTWERLSSTGCLYPLNSDQWWYYRDAKGPRYDLHLPLRALWTVSLTYLRQRVPWTPVPAEKTLLSAVKRF